MHFTSVFSLSFLLSSSEEEIFSFKQKMLWMSERTDADRDAEKQSYRKRSSWAFGWCSWNYLLLCEYWPFYTMSTWETSFWYVKRGSSPSGCFHLWHICEKWEQERLAEWIHNESMILTATHIFMHGWHLGGLCNKQEESENDKLAGWTAGNRYMVKFNHSLERLGVFLKTRPICKANRYVYLFIFFLFT